MEAFDRDYIQLILDKIEKWAERPKMRLDSETMSNFSDIVLHILFTTGPGSVYQDSLLEFLYERIGTITALLKFADIQRKDVWSDVNRISNFAMLIRSFQFTLTQGDVFSAVPNIEYGEEVLRKIHEKGKAGISNFNLLQSFHGQALANAMLLERVIGALEEIGCIQRIEEFVMITPRGSRYFFKEETQH